MTNKIPSLMDARGQCRTCRIPRPVNGPTGCRLACTDHGRKNPVATVATDTIDFYI
jgi:hypothetical protein